MGISGRSEDLDRWSLNLRRGGGARDRSDGYILNCESGIREDDKEQNGYSGPLGWFITNEMTKKTILDERKTDEVRVQY